MAPPGEPSFEVDTAAPQLAGRPPLLLSPSEPGSVTQEAGVVPKVGAL